MTKYMVNVESDLDEGYQLGTYGTEFVSDTIQEVAEQVFGGEFYDAESIGWDAERWTFSGCTNVSDEAQKLFDEKIDDLLKDYRSGVSFSVSIEVADEDDDDDDASLEDLKADLASIDAALVDDDDSESLKERKAILEAYIKEREAEELQTA